LNASLLFFEPNLLDYVIIHECAHLKHMNHSKSFWNLVAHYCSNYVMMRNQLKHQAKTLPVWLFQSDCLLIPQL
jgi:predicted metal-dependent hydrolase